MAAKEIAAILIKIFKNGNKLLICGNGGSAAMSQHFAAELIGKFEYDRKALPAIALTTDTSILTAISNDSDFVYVFSRQIEALGKPGDVLITLSSTGKSKNITEAIRTAALNNLKTIVFPMLGNSTAEVQEFQLKLMHDTCRLVEEQFK